MHHPPQVIMNFTLNFNLTPSTVEDDKRLPQQSAWPQPHACWLLLLGCCCCSAAAAAARLLLLLLGGCCCLAAAAACRLLLL
jgi:hypothetical protein